MAGATTRAAGSAVKTIDASALENFECTETLTRSAKKNQSWSSGWVRSARQQGIADAKSCPAGTGSFSPSRLVVLRGFARRNLPSGSRPLQPRRAGAKCGAVSLNRTMSTEAVKCVLLADRHHELSEGIRGLLETLFDAVVMVADEPSLQESAVRLQPSIAVVDLALTRGDGLGVVRRLRARCPDLRLILLSLHDEASSCRATLEAGANAFVLKRAIATDLLPAIEAVQAGKIYISPDVRESALPNSEGGRT
jgi:CheY-like chemotaxis protein